MQDFIEHLLMWRPVKIEVYCIHKILILENIVIES